jgi:hypothetical protein
MQSKLLHEADGKRTFAVMLQKSDEAMRCLQDFAVKEKLGASQVTAIGALSSARLAFFDWETKQYRPIPVEEQGRSRFPGRRYRGPPGRQTKHTCTCRAGAAGWDRSRRTPAGGSRQADAGDHHHGIAIPPMQGERPGKWAGADQRTQIVRLLREVSSIPSLGSQRRRLRDLSSRSTWARSSSTRGAYLSRSRANSCRTTSRSSSDM